MEDKLTIGQVAKICGVGVETIRFYERKRILAQPTRRGSAFRYYDLTHVEKIQFIRKAQKLGFTLSESKELVDLKFSPDRDCAPVKRKTQKKILEIEQKLTDLKNILKALRTFEARCNSNETTKNCSILDGLRKL